MGEDFDWGKTEYKGETAVAVETSNKDKAIKDQLESIRTSELVEDVGQSKEVWCIYGEKGDGKTTLALGFPGTIAALSFDRKTVLIKNNLYNKDKRIKVFDCIKFLDEEPSEYTRTARLTYEYVVHVLDTLKQNYAGKIDWILVDGTEILTKIAEQTMRFNNEIGPFQGIKNMNVWKERNLMIRRVYKKAMDCVNCGVIFTTYCDKDEIIEDGTVVAKKDIPKWVDVILWESDVVVKSYSKFEKDLGKRFYMQVDSSKIPSKIKTGTVKDVTGKGIFA